MARKSKDVLAQAAKETAAAEDQKGKRKKAEAPPSNVTDETIDIALARVDEAGIALEKAKEAQSQASGVYRSAIKAAKQLGLNNDSILEYRRMKKMDAGDYASMMTGAIRMAKVRNLPVGTQLSFLGEVAAKAEALPYNAGSLAAENGEPRANNPHEAGSQEFADWDNGYSAKMAAMMPKPMSNGNGAHA